MKRISALLNFLYVALIVVAVTYPVQAQQPTPGASQPAENVPEVNYHLTVMMPQYRFLDTSGYGGRVGEYDSLQQSLGGDLSFDYVDIPAAHDHQVHMGRPEPGRLRSEVAPHFREMA